MSINRRTLLLAGATLASAGSAGAQSLQNRPVRIVIPFPPGAAMDVVARMIVTPLAEALGQAVVIETRPGAGSTIGTAAVATAAPDGHTILFTSAAIASAPAVMPQLSFDPLRDFAPLSLLGHVPLVLTTGPQNDITSMAALLAAARARPGAITYATPGNGTPIHLAMELLQREAGIRLVHVPYRGTPVPDLIAGRVDLHLDSAHAAIARGRQGQVRLLGISTPRRLPTLPELPAIAETVPGYDASTWFAFFAPARVPAPILAQLSAALVDVTSRPALRTAMAEQGVEVQATGPEALARLLQADTERLGAIARAVGAKLD
ncbi:Bug family tripartite tricarboxylate transporter substrate binding protein [Sediminicoccus rosea]|uniref:Tripartite tricarboxylate transporter substrate-binding protein n=1 Tax=Sediminicoccus rosea TaxID=1225128 RepID=A0ABZ0PNP0_9PROT|nr:tripartite tricarboxylate transporter substrate-binding protein [Sediminicoccus rosea]WPB87257.1 tripartite tricarboxylate transporter substrate-binding protein [Sediminicoccus rosea]